MAMHAGPLWVTDHDSTVIELGELGPEDEVGGGPDPLSRRTRRLLRVAAVVLLCLVSLGASVRVPAGLGTPLWTGRLSLAGFALGSTFLAGADPGSRVVVGRDLFTGDPLWEARVDDPPQVTRSVGDNFAAVITREPSSPDQDDVRQNVTVILSADGTVLARAPGDGFGRATVGGYFLLVTSPAAGCPAEAGEAASAPLGDTPDQGGQCVDVAAFDSGTGAPVWRQTVPGIVTDRIDDDLPAPPRFFTGRGDGLIIVWDAATGAPLESYRLPIDARRVAVIGETAVTAERGPDGAVVTAYRPGPFRRLWSVTVPAGDTVIDSTAQFYLHDCGALICLHIDGGNAVIDPESGALRGFVGLEVIGAVGPVLIAEPTLEQGGTGRSRQVVHLLDAANGQELRVLPDTVSPRWVGSRGRALFARQSPNGTGFVVLNPDGQLRHLGTVPGADLSCEARDEILACVDPVGLLRVWRLPG